MNKVIARYTNGNMIKGTTADFSPMKDLFHVSDSNAAAGTKPVEIKTGDLKAFFLLRTTPEILVVPRAMNLTRYIRRSGEKSKWFSVMEKCLSGPQPVISRDARDFFWFRPIQVQIMNAATS